MRVWLAGKELPASGRTIVDEQEVIENLTFYFQKAPQIAKFYKVKLDASAQPSATDVARVARRRVMISIDLL